LKKDLKESEVESVPAPEKFCRVPLISSPP
jgi:hypothetical protein